MHPALQICLEFVEYNHGKNSAHMVLDYARILKRAKEVIHDAIESGEIERNLDKGELVDTGFTFCGNPILIKTENFHRFRKASELKRRFGKWAYKYQKAAWGDMWDDESMWVNRNPEYEIP